MSYKLPPRPLSRISEEDQKREAMRLASQKYLAFFEGLVFNMVQNPAFDPREEVDGIRLVQNAKRMADQMMDTLFTPKDKEEE